MLSANASVSYEDGSNFVSHDVKCSVRVYERFSSVGDNRVSINITVFGNEKKFCISGITAGGNRGVFYKFYSIGENTFLSEFVAAVERYEEKETK